MNRILAIIALLFAFAAPSAMAKNDYSCDKKFIFFPGGPEGGPFGTIVYNGAVAAAIAIQERPRSSLGLALKYSS